jgi:hypothetical protein
MGREQNAECEVMLNKFTSWIWSTSSKGGYGAELLDWKIGWEVLVGKYSDLWILLIEESLRFEVEGEGVVPIWRLVHCGWLLSYAMSRYAKCNLYLACRSATE